MTKNLKVCDECIRETGGCCSEVELSIHIDELKPFTKQFSKNPPKGHSLKLHDDETDVYLYSSNEDPCMFLDTENKCSIYEKRPLICRMYPVLWEDVEEEVNFFADFACPLTHMTPIRELNEWPKMEKNNGYIKKMGELDFKSKYTQYVNLTVIAEEVNLPHLLDSDVISE